MGICLRSPQRGSCLQQLHGDLQLSPWGLIFQEILPISLFFPLYKRKTQSGGPLGIYCTSIYRAMSKDLSPCRYRTRCCSTLKALPSTMKKTHLGATGEGL